MTRPVASVFCRMSGMGYVFRPPCSPRPPHSNSATLEERLADLDEPRTLLHEMPGSPRTRHRVFDRPADPSNRLALPGGGGLRRARREKCAPADLARVEHVRRDLH